MFEFSLAYYLHRCYCIVTENKRDCLYNLLKRQQIFLSNEVERKAYMDREYELEEIAKDKAKIKAQAEALQKAEADKAKAEAEAKAKDEALQRSEAKNAKLLAILAENGINISSD